MTDIKKEREYRDKLFRLMQENPDLPVVPMVDGEIGCDAWYNLCIGSLGYSCIREYIVINKCVYLREDDDPYEIDWLLSEKYGRDYCVGMTVEHKVEAYASLPWVKAIIVDINLP